MLEGDTCILHFLSCFQFMSVVCVRRGKKRNLCFSLDVSSKSPPHTGSNIIWFFYVFSSVFHCRASGSRQCVVSAVGISEPDYSLLGGGNRLAPALYVLPLLPDVLLKSATKFFGIKWPPPLLLKFIVIFPKNYHKNLEVFRKFIQIRRFDHPSAEKMELIFCWNRNAILFKCKFNELSVKGGNAVKSWEWTF